MKRLALCIGVLLLTGCSTDVVMPLVDSSGELQIRPALTRSEIGSTLLLHAVSFNANGALVFNNTVKWTSLDTTVAKSTDIGEITTIAPGWARVTATDASGVADTAVIAVSLPLAGISAGNDYGCGWTPAGAGYCWGSSNIAHYGVTGTGSFDVNTTLQPVVGGLTFTSIIAGTLDTCGLSQGDVYCWGDSEFNGLNSSTHCPTAFGPNCATPLRTNLTG